MPYKEHRHNIQKTVFCESRSKCEGCCRHSIFHNLGFRHYYSFDNLKIDTGRGEPSELEILKKWITEGLQHVTEDHLYSYISPLRKLERVGLIKFADDFSSISLNKEEFEVRIKTALDFESKYCDIFSQEATFSIIQDLPVSVELDKRLQQELQPRESRELSERFKSHNIVTERGLQSSQTGEEYIDEVTLTKDSIKEIGDEFEKRLRVVFSEFFKKK